MAITNEKVSQVQNVCIQLCVRLDPYLIRRMAVNQCENDWQECHRDRRPKSINDERPWTVVFHRRALALEAV